MHCSTRSATKRQVLKTVSPVVRVSQDSTKVALVQPSTPLPDCRGPLNNDKTEDIEEGSIYPSIQEMTFVRALFIAREQREFFAAEYDDLVNGRACRKTSPLVSLYPFLDLDGVIKVGGRLAQSDFLTEAQKYQVVIPRKGPLGPLLVRQVHIMLLHGTVQGCLATLRQKYWLLGAKGMIKKYVRDCVSCFRFMCRSTPPMMGDLPRERITPCDPFDYTGLDFGGPFYVKAADKSGHTKAYIALFVCFATKGVHIELVGSLSAAACMGAYIRFSRRRGKPKRVFSDNGTNFVGTRNELERIRKILTKTGSDAIPARVAKDGGEWVHIPPRSPHFGGLWESAIKSAKYHLKRIVGKRVFFYEELYTVMVMVEDVMNSRPLVEMSPDDNTFLALTPAMLITAKHFRHLPAEHQPEMPTIPIINKDTHKKRWEYAITWVASIGIDAAPPLPLRRKWELLASDAKGLEGIS